MENIDLSKVTLKNDLFDTSGYKLYYKNINSMYMVLKFSSLELNIMDYEPNEIQINITIDRITKKPKYDCFQVAYYRVQYHPRQGYGTKLFSRLDGPAVLEYQDNKLQRYKYCINNIITRLDGPAIVDGHTNYYYINGQLIKFNNYYNMLECCKNNNVDNECLSDEYFQNKKSLNNFKEMAQYFNANNVIEIIDSIQLINKLEENNEQ